MAQNEAEVSPSSKDVDAKASDSRQLVSDVEVRLLTLEAFLLRVFDDLVDFTSVLRSDFVGVDEMDCAIDAKWREAFRP